MKRIYDNINRGTTVDNDEEECAIKAEYCKCWVEQKLPVLPQTWLSPRQTSKEKNNATVADILTRNLELQQSKKLVNLTEIRNHHPELREWLETKRNIDKMSNGKHSAGPEIIKEPSQEIYLTAHLDTTEKNQASVVNVEKNLTELSKVAVEDLQLKTVKQKLCPSKDEDWKAVGKKDKKTPPLETDPDVICRRQKQIDYGKNTEGYRSYKQAVPKNERSQGDPRTPPIKQKLSRRSWDAMVRTWRLHLHEWDPPAVDALDLDTTDGGEVKLSPQKQSKALSGSQTKEETKLERAYKQLTQRVKAQRVMMSRLRLRITQSSPNKASEQQEIAVKPTP